MQEHCKHFYTHQSIFSGEVRLLAAHQHLAIKPYLFTLETVIFALDRWWVCVWILYLCLSNDQWINVLFPFFILQSMMTDLSELRHSYWLSTTCFPESSPHQHVNIQYISRNSIFSKNNIEWISLTWFKIHEYCFVVVLMLLCACVCWWRW